jgi:hypothetical protein
MITLYDLITILLTITGILVGFCIANEYSAILGIAAAIFGGLLGRWLGRIPTRIMIRNERNKMARLTVDELRQQLYKPLFSGGYTPNFLLLELRARGEDISEHISLVLNLMENESDFRRRVGFAALLSAYPYLVNKMRGYNPSWPVDKCKQWVSEARNSAEKAN